MDRASGRGWLVLAALVVGVGIAGAGWLAGRGMERFRAEERWVTVKGLVEREVQSDLATWTLSFRRASDSLADAHARLSADREGIVEFLRAQGFEAAELEAQPTRTLDRYAQDYSAERPRFRYVAVSSIVVTSRRVELVRTALGRTGDLLKAGIVLDGTEADGGRANPRYVYSKFNELRPALLAESTRNARATAAQFAGDSGAAIGRIRSASQGSIQIFGSDGNDESGAYPSTSTPTKRIRVVSTFDFELR